MSTQGKKILLRGARQLVTLQGPSGPRRGVQMRELGIIADGALLIQDGVIVQVGASRRLENLAEARDAIELSADGRVVVPGFVDPHVHPVCGPPLVAAYEMRLAGQPEAEIERLTGASGTTRNWLAQASRQRMELTGRRAIREFVRHGTTTLEARGGLVGDPKLELRLLRAFQALQQRPLDVVPVFQTGPVPQGTSPQTYAEELIQRVLPEIKRRRLAELVDVSLGPGQLDLQLVEPVLESAKRLGFGLKLTVDGRLEPEVVELATRWGVVAVEGVEALSPRSAAQLAAAPAIVTLLPGVSFHLLKRPYPPARELIDYGVPVALSTGFSAHRSPTCSMPAIIALACHEMHMTPAEALTAATINAACALGVAHRVGSLQSGKQADLLMLNISDYREIPYHFGMNLVAMVMKRGQVLYPRLEAL